MRYLALGLLITVFLLFSCKDQNITPKPRAYFRIDIPHYKYKSLNDNLPYEFKYSEIAEIEYPKKAQPYWINLNYKKYKARIYLTYYRINNNLEALLNDAHEFAYKHISKANDIETILVTNESMTAGGMIYKIQGSETATPINFFLTDSLNNYLRGALYFNFKPNNDSLAPIINSMEKDIIKIIESLEWKEINE